MKKHLFLMGCAAGLMLVPVKAEEKHTELGKHMEAMDDAFKGFRRETDAKKGAEQARVAQVETLKAAAEVPELVKKMPDGPDKAKAAVEYKKMMGKLYITLCEVEEAFLAGKPEEVTKLVEAVKTSKKEGHDKFIEEDEH